MWPLHKLEGLGAEVGEAVRSHESDQDDANNQNHLGAVNILLNRGWGPEGSAQFITILHKGVHIHFRF